MADISPEVSVNRKLKEHFDRHSVQNAAAKLAWRAYLFSKRFTYPKEFFEAPWNAGLIEGAVIGNPLCYIDEESGELMYERTGGGLWLAWDPKRPKEFPTVEHGLLELFVEGSLYAVVLDNVKDNDADTWTPTSTVNPFTLEHMLCLDRATPESLVTNGLARVVTYEKAYRNLGFHDQFGAELSSRSLAEETVLQVTPKGNSLVQLLTKSGDPLPQTEPELEFGLVPGHPAM